MAMEYVSIYEIKLSVYVKADSLGEAKECAATCVRRLTPIYMGENVTLDEITIDSVKLEETLDDTLRGIYGK
jgi:hypothetical protein